MGKFSRFCTKAFLLSFALLQFGCGGGQSSRSDNPVSGRKNSMIIHLLHDPEGLNPVNSVGANANNIHNILFDHLISLDFETLELVPGLAKEMPKVSADKRTFTFTLRDGLKFADGKPLSTKDVEFSFKAVMNPYVDSAPKRAELHNFVDCIAVDDKTIELKLSETGPFNLNRLAINFFVLPKHVYDANNLTDSYSSRDATLAQVNASLITPEANDAMKDFADYFEDERYQREKGFVIGSGRYMFDGWFTGQSIRLVKNPNYWNEGADGHFAKQNLDTIVYKTIPDVQTALQSLKSGEIDFSDQFGPDQFRDKMSGSGFDKYFTKKTVPYPFYEYVGWNSRIKNNPHKSFFADKKVRWAMSYLVDVDEIIENILGGTAKPITSMVYHGRPEHNEELKTIDYDESIALDLLEEAGWTDSDADGILDRTVSGIKTDFEFDLCYKRGNEVRQRIARHIQDRFKKVGIKVNVVDLDWTVMLERLKNHELDAWVGAWVYDSDEQDLYSLFHSSQILNEGYNWTSYANPQADSIMVAITREWDKEKRFALHRKIQEILYDDQPYTLLYANAARIGYNKRLKTDKWYGQRPCYDPPQFYVVKN